VALTLSDYAPLPIFLGFVRDSGFRCPPALRRFCSFGFFPPRSLSSRVSKHTAFLTTKPLPPWSTTLSFDSGHFPRENLPPLLFLCFFLSIFKHPHRISTITQFLRPTPLFSSMDLLRFDQFHTNHFNLWSFCVECPDPELYFFLLFSLGGRTQY